MNLLLSCSFRAVKASGRHLAFHCQTNCSFLLIKGVYIIAKMQEN